jgi:hypothetical protein
LPATIIQLAIKALDPVDPKLERASSLLILCDGGYLPTGTRDERDERVTLIAEGGV